MAKPSLSLWRRINVFLILCLSTFAFAQDLAFTSPDLSPISSGSGLPHYTVGDYVVVNWTTPWEETNLLVYQLKETAYAYAILSLNYPKNSTSFFWQAAAVDGEPLNTDHPFHFVLENGKTYDCANCVTQSPKFNVRRKSAQAGTTTSSAAAQTSQPASSTGAAAAPTTHKTSEPATKAPQTHTSSATPSAAGSAGDQNQATPSPSSSMSSKDLKVGLGVGLGVGIPLLLAIAGLCFLLARRRRKERQRISYRPTGSGNWTAEPKTRPETGVLGPWAGSGQRAESRASGLSQMSRNSYFDPFEFEKPEKRNQDSMDQLRQSIHSSGSEYSQNGKDEGVSSPSTTKASSSQGTSSRETPWPLQSNGNGGYDPDTKYAFMGGTNGAASAQKGWGAGTAQARRSDVNWANTDISSLEGIPEQLQPVHHQNGSGYASPTSNSGFTSPSRGDGRDWPLP